MLTREIATVIVKKIMERLGKNVNIFNEKGIILSSGDETRIDSFHEGAFQVIQTGKQLVIYETEKLKLLGTLPGINLPIKYEEKVIGVVGITGVPEEVEEFGEIVVMMTELMIGQFALLNQVEWKIRTREFLLEEILKENSDQLKINHNLKTLEVNLQSPFRVLVFRLNSIKRKNYLFNEIYQKIDQCLDFFLLKNHSLYGFSDEKFFVFILSNVTKEKEKNLQQQIYKLFTSYYEKVRTCSGYQVTTIDAISKLFYEVQSTLKCSNEPFVSVENFEIQLLLNSVADERKAIVRKRILKNLPKDLIHTLTVFFDHDLNLRQTAESLHVHRNTLIYRLNKINELTGYNPRIFKDAICLQMAEFIQNTQK